MKKNFAIGLFFLLVLTIQPVRADMLVLVHGYSGNALSWESSGVASILEAHGWSRAGLLTLSPQGVVMQPGAGLKAANRVYLVNLPSEAPIAVQTNYLETMLRFLTKNNPKESLILAGHSAGGVVARMALVRSGGSTTKALITIASPHLGTPMAEEALDATSSFGPIEVIKEFFGGNTYQYLKYSRPLYLDIVRPLPGTLLYWLNQQPHPEILYYSVMRAKPFLFGDVLVPGESMDMNNIPPLHGHSAVFTTPAGHSLTPGDGQLMVQILSDIKQKIQNKVETTH
ncbi:MAG: alpha/beta fold hydrolase [Magnetococcus sp. DMHC-6]